MKEMILSGSIILVIALLCILSLTFTNNFCSDMNGKLNDCATKIMTDDWDGAVRILDKAHKEYDAKLPLLKTFFYHDELFEIQNLFIKIETALSVKSAEMGLTEINTLISNFSTLSISEIPSMSNIL